tara:strand:+ start:1224 stop:1451 length:228 start_codon:yes stop_codon:yes gene_type:complete
MNNNVKLNDSVIAHFVKLLQLGLLTGTDIVDHFRMVRLTLEEGELFLNKDYESNQEENVNRMLQQASEMAETQEQ